MAEDVTQANTGVEAASRRFERRLNVALIVVGAFCLVACILYFRAGADASSAPKGASAAPTMTAALGALRLGANNALIDAAGRSVPLCGNVAGFFDSVNLDNKQLVVEGWAVDQARSRPVEMLLLFVDGRLLGQGNPGISRPDVASALNMKAAEKSGFALVVPSQGIVIQPGTRIQIFATDDKTCAVELPRNR